MDDVAAPVRNVNSLASGYTVIALAIPAGSTHANANDLNAAQVAVGRAGGNVTRAVRWTSTGQPQYVAELPGQVGATAYAINRFGVIVGKCVHSERQVARVLGRAGYQEATENRLGVCH